MLEWYGYTDLNGRLHVKRYFGPGDLEECIESSFVLYLAGPVRAETKALAIQKLTNKILNELGADQWR